MKNSEESNQQTVESCDSTKINSSDANNNQYDNGQLEGPDSQSTMNGNHDRFDSDQDRKLFLGYGSDLLVNEQNIEDFFTKFGPVHRVNIKRDCLNNKPRGFAFITMTNSEDVQKVLDACPLTIRGKTVDVKLAKSRPISKKVFVGGIDPKLSKEEITGYFQTYGKVIDIELPFDRMKKKRREFCFIIFDTEDSANHASEDAKQTIFGRECDVKKACPQPIAQQQKRQNLQNSYNNGNMQSHYGGLNHCKNSKVIFSSPNSMKNRGGYRNKNSMNRSNNGYYSNGRRSVDSQYGTIYENNNASSYNSNWGSRKGSHQSSGNRQGQYMNGGSGQKSSFNSHDKHAQTHHQMHSFNQQQQQQQQPQAFYDPIAQNYYGYPMTYPNDYYLAQQHYEKMIAYIRQKNCQIFLSD